MTVQSTGIVWRCDNSNKTVY